MEYLYVGNEKANREQFSPKTDKLEYLISQSLPNIKKFLPDTELAKQIETVLGIFYNSYPQEKNTKYKYFPEIKSF